MISETSVQTSRRQPQSCTAIQEICPETNQIQEINVKYILKREINPTKIKSRYKRLVQYKLRSITSSSRPFWKCTVVLKPLVVLTAVSCYRVTLTGTSREQNENDIAWSKMIVNSHLYKWGNRRQVKKFKTTLVNLLVNFAFWQWRWIKYPSYWSSFVPCKSGRSKVKLNLGLIIYQPLQLYISTSVHFRCLVEQKFSQFWLYSPK